MSSQISKSNLYLILRHPMKDFETRNSFKNTWKDDRIVLNIETTPEVIEALEKWGKSNEIYIYRTSWGVQKPRVVSRCIVEKVDREANVVYFCNQHETDFDPPFRAKRGDNHKIA